MPQQRTVRDNAKIKVPYISALSHRSSARLASSSPAVKSGSAKQGFFSKPARRRSACKYSLWSGRPGTGWASSKQELDDKGIRVRSQLIAPSGLTEEACAPWKDTWLICKCEEPCNSCGRTTGSLKDSFSRNAGHYSSMWIIKIGCLCIFSMTFFL